MKKLKILIRANFRENYPGILPWVGEIFAIFVSLLIYKFTAASFSPNFQLPGIHNDYFEFILIGELALAIPMTLIDGMVKFIRRLSSGAALEETLLQSDFGLQTLLLGGVSEVPRTMFHMLSTMILAFCFFNFKTTLLGVLSFVLVQIFFIPVFTGLGMVLVSFYCFFGRGLKVISSIALGMSILSGAYFPTSVFSEKMDYFIHDKLPYVALVSASRAAFFSELGTVGEVILLAAGWSVLVFGFGYLLLKASLRTLSQDPVKLIVRD